MTASRPEPPLRRAAHGGGVPLAVLCILLLLAIAVGGCVSKTKAQAQARRAYLAGQQEAMMRMQQVQAQSQGPTVTIKGQVHNPIVPWTEGLTLLKAIATAQYCGVGDPAEIIVIHGGLGRRYELKQVVDGPEIPLQPGDIVQITPPSPAPKP